MTVHETGTTCPWCHQAHPVAGNMRSADTNPPEAGDATLCIDCGRWSVFQYDGTLRRPTNAEVRQFTQNPDMRRAWTAWFMTTKKETK